MTCVEFGKLIMPFIHGNLCMAKKEELIMHLSSCPKCAEELEIYYIIVNCIKELDDEVEFPDNYHREFLNFIRFTEREIKLYKRRSFRHKVSFSAVIGLSVLLTGVSFHTEEETGEKTGGNYEFLDNDLDMRFRFRDDHVLYDHGLDVEAIKKWLEERRIRLNEE